MKFGSDDSVSLLAELVPCILVSQRHHISTGGNSNVGAKLACYPLCISARTLKLGSLYRMRGWRRVGSIMRFVEAVVEMVLLGMYSQTGAEIGTSPWWRVVVGRQDGWRGKERGVTCSENGAE